MPLGRNLVAVLVSLLLAIALAEVSSAQPNTSDNPRTIYTRDPASRPALTAIIARARQKGVLRVIAGLDIALRDEDTLSEVEAAAQSRALLAVQRRVLQRSLGSAGSGRSVLFDHVPFVSVWVRAGELQRLLADPEVVSVREDIPVPPSLRQSTRLIEALRLWDRGITGSGVVVAVLDTGAAKNHEMLKDKTVAQACFSTNNGSISSLCPGGVTELIGLGAGRNCPLNIDGCEHGTLVGSIAVGSSDTLDGVALDSNVILVQVFSKISDAATCNPAPAPCIQSFTTDQVKGLEQVFNWRRKHPIAAVNMSLGGGAFTSTCDADRPEMAAIIQKLRNAGIATVIASGNEGLNGAINSPACISSAIAVGSSTKEDEISDFSNHSPLVRVLAPGSDIKAARAGTTDGYTRANGTSLAAPHVAGAFALLRQFKNSLTVDDIATALICTGKPLKRPGYQLSKPRIQLLQAWRYLRGADTEPLRWDFTSIADKDDWEDVLGVWNVALGYLTLTKFNTDPASWWNAVWHQTCLKNAFIEARMRRVDGQTDELLFGDSGVFINADLGERISGYWVAYNSYTVCDICDKKGQAVIWRLDGYSLIDNSGDSRLLCVRQNAGVNVDGYNKLRIVLADGNIRFNLNGQEVCNVNDSSYVAGSVGVGTVIPIPAVGKQNFKLDYIEIVPEDAASTAQAREPTTRVVHPAGFRPLPVAVGMSPLGMRR